MRFIERPWDTMAGGCIVISGVIEASQQALKDAPTLQARFHWLNLDGAWNYVPLALILFAGAIWSAKTLGWLKYSRKLVRVQSVAYRNEAVLLDGRYFQNCIFDRVTFRFNGGRFHIVNAQITGPYRFETQNSTIRDTVSFLKFLNLLEMNFSNSWTDLPPEYFS